MSEMENPLSAGAKENRLPDFAAIEPAHVMPAIEQLLAEYREGVKRQLALETVHGWDLVEAETRWADTLAKAWSPVSHLNSVVDNADLRKVFNAGLERLTEQANWRQQHEGLFEAYRALKDSPDFERWSAVQRRIVELELRDFHLAGVDLPPQQKAEYREITLRLSQLRSKFSENVLDATRAWTRRFV